ncbi:uncharacterized protein LOC663847 [Tribolium castaneum]|uniref:PI-PLC X domain-containing protein 1-like Protein n=1 Tax=Tribolium castaneum TaxID=7070 RepID=A0A139WNB2_TRICA|nr:PREDICTED: uncharacterized protein LOC663847 [Tribolium castaneum]KYB29347.1 PI-PLC X domain-containing protein 1-like Protein [Tribolium castaneum]|eukprot:XP_015840709.1 PREDICTED: uncharacterized protein LOC663847 [Tribolium castaneum]
MINTIILLSLCFRFGTTYPKEFARRCGHVHLTISASQDTNLELNWITDCTPPDNIRPDYIALYHYNLKDRSEETPPLVKIRASDHPSGYYKTKIKFGQPWLPGNWEYRDSLTRADQGPHCYPYWIASIKGNDIIDTRCLGIQPTWMNDNRMQIGTQKIGNLFIPGTHNSGAYVGVPKILENYILNQDRSIWTQLVHGIRYLDLRIGYYENDGFYVNHDLVRITKVVQIFKEIRKFVQLAPKEIIVVDFHRFPYPSNFNSTLHEKFVSLVYDYLGDLALPPGGLQVGKGPTLNEIWAQNKNVIICYADKAIARENYWLWQPLYQHWANTKNVDTLKSFLSRAIKEHRVTLNPMFALMAELTPQPIDLFFRTNNLRKLANDVNRKVTVWFRDEWARDVNIVATDYFLGNDIINVAIEANNNR